MGLKPVIKPACPKCDFVLKYYYRNPDVNPANWVLSEESREHLETGHLANVVQITRRRSQPRFRKNIRAVRKVA